MYLTTDGLVLRETACQETSKLLTVLTGERGLLTFKARGVNRRSSHLKAPCQLLAYGEFTVHENRGYYTVYEAEARELFPALRADLELLSLGSYFAQLLELVSQSDSVNSELLALGLHALYALSYQKRSQKLVKAAFELRLLCLAGYTPCLDGCIMCGNPQPDRFCPKQGMLCCSACESTFAEKTFPVTAGALAAMRHIICSSTHKLFSFSLGENSLDLLAAATEAYLLAQMQRGFSALDFYKTLI